MSSESHPKPVRFGGFEPMPKRFMIWDDLHKRWFLGNPTMEAQRLEVHAFDFFGETMACGEVFHDPHDDGVWKDIGWTEMLNHLVCVQTTGLYDKNGQEIFEGAILQDDVGDLAVVKFENGSFWVDWVNDEFTDYVLENDTGIGFKIVGHILSNHELLEEK